MRSAGFESASGLRPASAFVIIAFVLLAVTGKAAHIAFFVPGEQLVPHKTEQAPWPEFEIVDTTGKALAVSIECFDLTASPRSMWRSHTPLYMAERLAEVLGEIEPVELLDLMLPQSACDGAIRVSEPRLLSFDRETALAVERWIDRGALDGEDGAGRIAGLWVVPSEERGRWTLEWRPEETLSKEERTRHLDREDVDRPGRWTSRLLRDLATFVDLSRASEELSARLDRLGRSGRRAALRDAVWAELMPSDFRVVRRRIGPVVAHALCDLFADEAVTTPWQMDLVARLDRRHPVRSSDELLIGQNDAFSILGHWGVLSPEQAHARALRDVGLRTTERTRNEEHRAYVAERARDYETTRRPHSGLEMLCGAVLEHPAWKKLLADGGRTYNQRMRSLPRDRRRPWKGAVPNYFGSATDAEDVPRVITTIDAELQRAVHEELLGVMDEHDPALAMAIVLDVASGTVHAVDSVLAYDVKGFSPVRHEFTPGSTMKAIIMSIALDEGLVRPDTVFETFAPDGLRVRDAKGHERHIEEALGAPKEARITAREGLAHSVNAVLVQIGLRIDAPTLRDRLVRLGYGQRPDVGIGPETPGRVPTLEDGAWSYCYTHASVSFGHEIGVSLWQHAAALATVLRGGAYRPLRLIEAVEQGGQRWNLPRTVAEPVLREHACSQVREIMTFAASEGTGRHVAHPSAHPEFAMLGTKTGTTEKVPAEYCLHVEFAHNVQHQTEGSACSRKCLRSMRGSRDHGNGRQTCYTSSMCAVGRLHGDDREWMVLVVVDDPRGEKKFGADVAGAAGIAMLRRAAGLDRLRDVAASEAEPALSASAFNVEDFPWAEDVR